MSWAINQKEVSSVLLLPALKRYNYAIKRIVDWKELWSLKSSDGWVLAVDDDGNEVVPIWPHEIYANLCALNNWKNTMPEKIKLDIWMSKWIPGIIRDKRAISVFPTPELNGILVSPERFKKDLEEEQLKYL